MAPFLFRKQKQDQRSSVLISPPTTLQSPPTTPLYSRFAASSARDGHGAPTPVRKVSLPKPLGGPGRLQRGEKHSGEHTLTIQAPQSLLDKPLPPPVPPPEDKPTIPTISSRPTALPTQHQSQGRVSVNADKPLPRPGSSQSLLLSPGIPSSLSSKTTFSRTRSPSTSSSSVRRAADPQTKTQQKRSTSTSNQRISNDPSHTLEPTSSRKTDDSPAGTRVTLIASTSTESISSTQRTSRKGSSSELVMDLPEALSSQNFNETNHVPSLPSSLNSRRALLDRGGSSGSGKSLEQQTLVSTPSFTEGGGDMTLLPSRSPTLRRGLPSPPPTPMDSDANSLSRASIRSAYHELYPSHVIMNNERRSSVLDTDQQRPLYRNQTVVPSSPPSFNTPRADLQNGISERHPQHVPRNRNQQHLYPDHRQPTHISPQSNPVPLAKSLSIQSNVSSLPRGKPRIFAAMEAQQDLQAPSLGRQSPMEEFSTPKLQIDTLPEITYNGDVDFSSTAKAIEHHNVAPGLEPHHVHHVHSKKSSTPRSATRQGDPRTQNSPQSPRTKKLSKARQPTDSPIHAHPSNGSMSAQPASPDGGQQKRLHKTQPKSRPTAGSDPELAIQLDDETIRNAGMPLDDDPFARVEGVKMLKPTTRHKRSEEDSLSSLAEPDASKEPPSSPPQENASQAKSATDGHRQTRKDKKAKLPVFLFDPMVKKEPLEPSSLLVEPQILASLLQFISFYEWCTLLSLSKEIRSMLVRNAALRETALERFLKTIGYTRWTWDSEPLSLSLQDLNDYMRGVSTPTHEYARVAAIYMHSLKMPTTHRDPSIRQMVQRFVASTRAYNRVLLRLRAQVEKEATLPSSAQTQPQSPGARAVSARLSPTTRGGNSSRPSSRAPSPAASHTSMTHLMGNGSPANTSQTNLAYHSPLFKLRRAPLLRVFVPSPEGDWLSDKSVLECEAECKRAGVQHLLRLGDVVWDVAAGDEGNVGRLVWDGTYLIDLDFTYSAIGDLPKYLHALALPPSYFHRVIRTGNSNSNPIVHIDITPWGQETATNIQLVQDRIRTETSQGAYHNVMHWVHRSSFHLRPVRSQQPGVVNRIPIPNTDSLFVDPGWYGTIVVETEGTNEALADMHERCGLGAHSRHVKPTLGQIENRKVFRILRERSRPGEIWIRAVSMKERLL